MKENACMCGGSEWCVKCTSLPPKDYFQCNLIRMDLELSEMHRYLEDNHVAMFADVSVAMSAIGVLQEKLKNGL